MALLSSNMSLTTSTGRSWERTPLAGHYLSKKAFIEGTFAKLGQVLPNGAQLHTENVIVEGDQAVVELHSLATARNGM
jgi:uncharacterized protein